MNQYTVFVFLNSRAGFSIIPILYILCFVLIVGLLIYISDKINEFKSKKLNKLFEKQTEEKNLKRKQLGILRPVTKIGYFPTLNLVESRFERWSETIHPDAQIGFSEKSFYSFLIKYFDEKKIFWNQKKISTKKPDFTYEDKLKNIYLVIEIDEPYVFKTGEPIHYIENEADTEKNIYYSKDGWTAIRFSEFQILQYPNECCKFIAEVIDFFDLDYSYKNSIEFQNIKTLPIDKRWTYEEAKQMALKGARNNYNYTENSTLNSKIIDNNGKQSQTNSIVSNTNFDSDLPEINKLKFTIISADPEYFSESRNWKDKTPRIIIKAECGEVEITNYIHLCCYKDISDFENGIAPEGFEFRSSENGNENYLVNLETLKRVESDEKSERLSTEIGHLAYCAGIRDEKDIEIDEILIRIVGQDVGIDYRKSSLDVISILGEYRYFPLHWLQP